MCLTINTKRHYKLDPSVQQKWDSLPEPFIADRPLVITKRVELRNGKYYSPYQGCLIRFQTVLNSIFSRSRYYSASIDCGYHGFKFDATPNDWKYRYGLCDRGACDPYQVVTIYGVIPVGTKYYMGTNNEVVTESVIYFKTLDELNSYYGIEALDTPHRGDYVEG